MREREREREYEIEKLEIISIFLASDDNYAPFLATTITSICYNTKNNVDFYILDGGICNFNKNLIQKTLESINNTNHNKFTIEFIKIDTTLFAETNMNISYISRSTYNRILIPLVKPDINRAIYIDVDVVVLDDIVKLWSENLEGKIIGASKDLYYFDDKMNTLEVKKYHNDILQISKGHIFFNAGVLLIDCKKWRENHITEKIIDYLPEYEKTKPQEYFVLNDQDILNKIFCKNYKSLPLRYNIGSAVFYSNDNTVREEITSMVIRHYTGTAKGWNSNIIGSDYFWFFAEMTPLFYKRIKGIYDNAKLKDEFLKQNIKVVKIKLFSIIPILKIKKTINKIKIYFFELLLIKINF